MFLCCQNGMLKEKDIEVLRFGVVALVALRLEHLEQATFGFLVIGLHEGKPLAGDRLLGLFPAGKGQETLPRHHLAGALLSLGLHIAAIDPDGQRAMGDR